MPIFTPTVCELPNQKKMPKHFRDAAEKQNNKLDPMAKRWDDDWLYDTSTEELWGTIDNARFPLQYMANLFSAGDTTKVSKILKKMREVITISEFVGISKIVKSECVGINFVNPVGGNTFTVNGVPVIAGNNYSIQQNVGDLDVTQYLIQFQAGAGVDECYVSRLVLKNK